MDSCWLSFEVFFRFSLLSFRLRRLFRSGGFRSKSSFVSLYSFFVWELSCVQVLSCSFGSSHSFETSPCRWTPADFRSKSSFGSRCSFFVWDLSFVQVLSCSFDSSHSFATALFRWTPAGFRLKSFFRFSLPFCRFKPLFRSSPLLFVRLLLFVWNLLSFVGLLLAFVRSSSFVSVCSSFVSGISFVQALVWS